MSTLDPLTLNLHGLNLIEASAGTGKTHTLTTLYLRFLLEMQLHPANILVVTFTKPATEALRERVRHRIVQAMERLEGKSIEHDSDPILTRLLAKLPDRPTSVRILANALTSIDQAAIYTIHSFCQRMLKEYAFESNMDFAAELITDDLQLCRTAVMDVWRRKLDDISVEEATWIKNTWSSPDKLLKTIKSILGQDDLRLIPILHPHFVQQVVTRPLNLLTQIRTEWKNVAPTCLKLLIDSSSLNKGTYKPTSIETLRLEMDDFATAHGLPNRLPEHFKLLRSTHLTKKTNKGGKTPQHQFFDLCDQLEDDLIKSAHKLKYALSLQDSLHQTRITFNQAKTAAQVLSFDDLLGHLDAALAGPNAEILAKAIRSRFPVALIDEFQDTDAKQYRIFRRIYNESPNCSLFLIGDPKQSIYGFRGADIFTYMGARTDAIKKNAEHTLGINWRSTSRLVTAINTLFSQILTPFIYADIPFQAVAPSPKADSKRLIINGIEPIPLQLWTLATTDDNLKKNTQSILVNSAENQASQACAEYIAQILQYADSGLATLGKNPLLPSDIVILVRNRKHGELVQTALRACNINSVTMSDDDIFKSAQADELYVVLNAIGNSNNEGMVKAALATTIMGWNATSIDALNQDPKVWEAVQNRLQEYRRLWLEKGFMLAWQRLLIGERIPQRLLQIQDGERQLTNLLQLGELLQTAAQEHVDMEGLLNWLVEQKLGDHERDETKQLRLESDSGLVKIMTMHKSKGLEYPIVFIPFPWSLKPHSEDKKTNVITFHDPIDLTPCLDCGSDNQTNNSHLHLKEVQAENARLFYVAVTRAANLCILCWGNVNTADTSIPALLFHPDPAAPGTSRLKSLGAAELRADLAALAARAPSCIEVRNIPAPTGMRWLSKRPDPNLLQAAKFTRTITADWHVASYSRLIRNDESLRPDHDTALAPAAVTIEEPSTTTEPSDSIFAFPAGAEAGLYLHAILEKLDFANATTAVVQSAIQKLLPSYASLTRKPPANLPDWGSVAVTLINNCLDTPLEPIAPANQPPMRLRDISWHNRLSELEFHYPATNLTPTTLYAALAPFPVYKTSSAKLKFDDCRGLMHGFIDLIFRHRGRYYVADYKSNRLGMHLSAYNHQGMREAIQSHRYDLQYLIYTVALTRFLAQRIPDYDYTKHFGGVYYLFLRGMRPVYGPEYGVYFDRPDKAVIDALERLC